MLHSVGCVTRSSVFGWRVSVISAHTKKSLALDLGMDGVSFWWGRGKESVPSRNYHYCLHCHYYNIFMRWGVFSRVGFVMGPLAEWVHDLHGDNFPCARVCRGVEVALWKIEAAARSKPSLAHQRASCSRERAFLHWWATGA